MPESSNTLNRILTGMLLLVIVIGMILLGFRIMSDGSDKDDKNPYEYDISTLKKIDPELIHYSEVQSIKIDSKQLNGIAVGPGDRIYVSGDTTMHILQKDGKELFAIDLKEPARCIALDEHRNIYLGMLDHVEVYDSSGNKKGTWESLGENAHITSIAVSSENVFVADAGNRVVLRFDDSGKLQNRIGEKDVGREIRGFLIPSPYFDVAVAKDGFLWVVNPGYHAFENYTNEGDLRSWWEKASMDIEGFCGCCNPTHFAILGDGSFVTSEKGIVRVKIHNQVGNFVSVVAGPDHFEEDTVGLDLAVDSSGRILVLDPKTRSVRVFVKKQNSRD